MRKTTPMYAEIVLRKAILQPCISPTVHAVHAVDTGHAYVARHTTRTRGAIVKVGKESRGVVRV